MSDAAKKPLRASKDTLAPLRESEDITPVGAAARCPGSRGDGLDLDSYDSTTDTAICPSCGQRVKLLRSGYFPKHVFVADKRGEAWTTDAGVAAFTGTCQRCGSYWDVRQQPVCPCGGEVL